MRTGVGLTALGMMFSLSLRPGVDIVIEQPDSSGMGIGVMNWHFSRSFRLIFLNTYDPYLSESHLINLTTLVLNHFDYSLCSQVTKKHVY